MSQPTDEERGTQHLYKLLEALHESESRYRSLVDNLKEAVFQTDAEGLWTFLNPAWEEITGFSVKESLGKLFLDYVYPDDRELNQQRFTPLIERKKEYCRHEIRYCHKDGGFRWIEVFARLTLNQQGEVIGTTGTLMDISERKAAAAHAEEIQGQLLQTQKLESLGVLAGGIAHDFNNILAAVMGHAAMAERKTLTDPEAVKRHLQTIVQSSEKAADLCRQMLAYSGQGQFLVQKVNLSALIQSILNILEVSLNKGVSLKLSLMDGMPDIEADGSQIQQIAMNLITNANESMTGRNGVVSVRTGVMYANVDYLQQCLHAEQADEGHFVFMEVSDTGCGMNSEVLGKIFDPFFTTKFTGRGLGMSAVLGIVRAQKGAVKIYSEEDQGTTLRILFPSTDGAHGNLTTLEMEAVGQKQSSLILVVDDEPTIRNMAVMMLNDMGFCEVLVAANGQEAVEIYRREKDRIAVVLLDMTMPLMNGEEAYRQLRVINPEVKVILSSGYAQQSIEDRFSGKRLFGFLQKPYSPEALQNMVESALNAPEKADAMQ